MLEWQQETNTSVLKTRRLADRVLAPSRVRAKPLPSCLTLCDPVDHSLPGSSVHGTLQARILEWVAVPSSEGSSQPRDRTCISYVSYICRQEGNGNPLQYSCLENPMDRGAWLATVHGVAKRRTSPHKHSGRAHKSHTHGTE